MTNSRVSAGLVALVALLAGCAGTSGMNGGDVSIDSIADTKFVCGYDAPVCRIVVAVEYKSGVSGDCEVAVDIDDVKIKLKHPITGVKKHRPVEFVLMRRSMVETRSYEFVGTGITWLDDNAHAAPLVPQPDLSGKFEHQGVVGGTVSQWTAKGKIKANGKPSNYRALVREVGKVDACYAIDPKIANDG